MILATMETWLSEAEKLDLQEFMRITDGAGRISYQDTAAALRAQYPKLRFITGEHGTPWIKRWQ